MPLPDMTGLASAAITPTIAAHVLWHFERSAVPPELVLEPGEFVKALIEAVAKADPQNKVRLGLGFPGYVAAVYMYQGMAQGEAQLREVAGQLGGHGGR